MLGSKAAKATPEDELAIRALLYEDAKAEKVGAAYPGNLGAVEMVRFYQESDPRQQALMDHLLDENKFREAWELLKRVTGVKLHDLPGYRQAAGPYEGIDFKPPESVANAAAKGLEYRQKASPSNRGGLTTEEAGKQGIGSGVQRATNLKNRTNVSPEVIGQMVAFFSRHEKNKGVAAEHKGEPWNDKGHVAWLLWGGDPGKAWAEKVKGQMEKADAKKASLFFTSADLTVGPQEVQKAALELKLPHGWKKLPAGGSYIIYESADGLVRVQDTKRAGHPSRYQVIYKPVKETIVQDGKLVDRAVGGGHWLEVDNKSSLAAALALGVQTEANMKKSKTAKAAYLKVLEEAIAPICKDPDDADLVVESIQDVVDESLKVSLEPLLKKMVPIKFEDEEHEENGREYDRGGSYWYSVTWPSKAILQWVVALDQTKRWTKVGSASSVVRHFKPGSHLPALHGPVLKAFTDMVKARLEYGVGQPRFEHRDLVPDSLEEAILDSRGFQDKFEEDISHTDSNGEPYYEASSLEIHWAIEYAGDISIKTEEQGEKLRTTFTLPVNIQARKFVAPGDYDYGRRSAKQMRIAKSNQKVVEVPNTFHQVELQEPKATRKEFPFEGFIDFQGLKIDVENAKGSTRSGEGPEGPWSTYMNAHYGEIRGTEGTDGDKLDVYVGDNHDSSLVVVIHQHNPWDGKYDEDKVVLGCDSIEEAIGLYKSQYDRPGFYREGEHTAMPIGAFWRWVMEEKNKGKKVKVARVAALKWTPVSRLDANTLKDATWVKWVRLTSAGVPGQVVARRMPNGWQVQLLKADEGFNLKAPIKGRPKTDADILKASQEASAGLMVVKGEAPAAPAAPEAPSKAPTTLDDEKIVKSLLAIGEKKLQAFFDALPKEWGVKAQVGSHYEGAFFPGRPTMKGSVWFHTSIPGSSSSSLSVQVFAPLAAGMNPPPDAPLDSVAFSRMSNNHYLGNGSRVPRAQAAKTMGLMIDANLALIQSDIKRAQKAFEETKASPAQSGTFTADEVTSFLRSMSTQRGGRNRSVEYDHSSYGPFWSAEPSNRQRLDHYVGQNYWPDEGDDPEGWDQEGWEEEYAGPLRQEVQTKLDARFGKGVLTVDIGEKGHIEVQLDAKGRSLMKTAQHWKKGAVETQPGALNATKTVLSNLLAHLRAMGWNHLTSHWQVAGDTSYGDHLLFERLYGKVVEETDGLAEKLVGLFGKDAVDGAEQAKLMAFAMYQASSTGCPFERGLQMERAFQVMVKKTLDALEALGTLSLGLDDFIRTMANDHETHIYLLQQRLGGVKVASARGMRPDPVRRLAARHILRRAAATVGTDTASIIAIAPESLYRLIQEGKWEGMACQVYGDCESSSSPEVYRQTERLVREHGGAVFLTGGDGFWGVEVPGAVEELGYLPPYGTPEYGGDLGDAVIAALAPQGKPR